MQTQGEPKKIQLALALKASARNQDGQQVEPVSPIPAKFKYADVPDEYDQPVI